MSKNIVKLFESGTLFEFQCWNYSQSQVGNYFESQVWNYFESQLWNVFESYIRCNPFVPNAHLLPLKTDWYFDVLKDRERVHWQ